MYIKDSQWIIVILMQNNSYLNFENNFRGNSESIKSILSSYDKLVELHKGSSKEPLKVEDIGGLECSKCHY